MHTDYLLSFETMENWAFAQEEQMLNFYKFSMTILFLRCVQMCLSAANCIKHFHWLAMLFWPIRFDVTIVSIGNDCNVKPDRPEPPFGAVVKSKGNPLYTWVQVVQIINNIVPLRTIQRLTRLHLLGKYILIQNNNHPLKFIYKQASHSSKPDLRVNYFITYKITGFFFPN